MHVHARRREVVLDDQREGAVQALLQLPFHGHAAVLADVPLGKERQFTLEQRAVVGRQHAGLGGQLPADQRVDGQVVEWPVGVRAGRIDHVEHGLAAQVVEQQEAVVAVPFEHLRRRHAGLGHQLRHLHEGGAVFLVGRRIHHDARAAVGGVEAEVAAKARVGRRQPDGVRAQLPGVGNAGQPAPERFGPLRICPENGLGGVWGRGRRGRRCCHG
ncbi:hypothetical protein D3C72_1475930 [compost metagenome]